MKKDKLKYFIEEHREEFDVETPSADLWDRIEQQMDGHESKKVFSIKRYIPYAAAAVILVAAFVFINTQKTKEILSDKNSGIEQIQNDLVPDFGEVENYYVIQVNDRLNDLKQYEIDPDFLDEVSDLKEEFDELKLEMGVGADPGVVLEAMIDNYRLRLELLEDLLNAMKRTQQNTTRNEVIN